MVCDNHVTPIIYSFTTNKIYLQNCLQVSMKTKLGWSSRLCSGPETWYNLGYMNVFSKSIHVHPIPNWEGTASHGTGVVCGLDVSRVRRSAKNEPIFTCT